MMGMLTSVVFWLYPMVLPRENAVLLVDGETAKAGDYG